MATKLPQAPIPNRLAGQVAIITGAGGNIGLCTACRFLLEGAKVVLVDIDPAGLENAVSQLKEKLPDSSLVETNVHRETADVTSEEDVKRFVDATVTKFGRLDTAFLCAGISYSSTSVLETSGETYDKVMKINCKSAFLGIKHVAAAMRNLGTGGSIILASSIAGLRATPGLIAYSAAKYALRGMCQSAAAELGPYDIRVNTVHPCGVNTPMFLATWPEEKMKSLLAAVPLGRWAEVDDVAAAVSFLASQDARFLTGVALKIDGGAVSF